MQQSSASFSLYTLGLITCTAYDLHNITRCRHTLWCIVTYFYFKSVPLSSGLSKEHKDTVPCRLYCIYLFQVLLNGFRYSLYLHLITIAHMEHHRGIFWCHALKELVFVSSVQCNNFGCVLWNSFVVPLSTLCLSSNRAQRKMMVTYRSDGRQRRQLCPRMSAFFRHKVHI